VIAAFRGQFTRFVLLRRRIRRLETVDPSRHNRHCTKEAANKTSVSRPRARKSGLVAIQKGDCSNGIKETSGIWNEPAAVLDSLLSAKANNGFWFPFWPGWRVPLSVATGGITHCNSSAFVALVGRPTRAFAARSTGRDGFCSAHWIELRALSAAAPGERSWTSISMAETETAC